MPAPAPYTRLKDFTQYALDHTSQPYNASDHDAELDAVEQTLDDLCENIALIQRDDGRLANAVVEIDSLSTAVRDLMASAAFTVRGGWVTATHYTAGDMVIQASAAYLCMVTHNSGVFATDLAAGDWGLLTNNGSLASGTAFSPTATITSVTVQAAIVELEGDLLPMTLALAHQTLGGI